MTEYDFNLRFKLGDEELAEDYLDALYEAGSDDAVVGVSKPGQIGLDFSRESRNAYEAISSAIRDVKHAIPHAKLIEIGPDLMGVSELGGFFNVSRQYIRSLINNSPRAPLPLHTGSSDVYRFAEIVSWLISERRHMREVSIDESLIDLAEATMTLNHVREMVHWMNRKREREIGEWDEDYYEQLREELSPRYRDLLRSEDLRRMA